MTAGIIDYKYKKEKQGVFTDERKKSILSS